MANQWDDALQKMTIEELIQLNEQIFKIVADRKTEMAMQKRACLSVGDIVAVNHPKLRGVECRITKINRTKAVLQRVGGKGTYNVPLTMINPANN